MCWGVHVNEGERSDSRDVARRSRGCSCLVTLPDRRCDNDDATSDSITCSLGVRLGVLLCCGVDVVRVGAVTFVTTVTICCDNNVTFFSCAMMGGR